MKNNKKMLYGILLLAVLLTFVFQINFASATVSLGLPTSSSTISGVTPLNATITSVITTNFTCLFYAQSASTANSSWTLIASIGNNTMADAHINSTNGTYNTIGLEDSNDYSFNATCFNLTGNLGQGVNTGITIDNTIPQLATSTLPATASIDGDGSVTFSGTVVGRNTTGCTLFFSGTNPGTPSYTMTHTANSCSHSLTGMSEQTYNWYIRASDGTNTTDTATQTMSVDVKTSSGKAVILAQESNLQLSGNGDGKTFTIVGDGLEGKVLGLPIWLIIVLFIIVAIIIVLIAKSK